MNASRAKDEQKERICKTHYFEFKEGFKKLKSRKTHLTELIEGSYLTINSGNKMTSVIKNNL
jgi:hypothetical protein